MEETKQMENPDPQSFQSGTSSAEADFPIPQEEKMKELSTLEECSLDPNDEISALKAEIDRLRTSLSQKEEEQKKVMEEMEEFSRLFPTTPIREVPESVWRDVGAGIPLSAAYALYEKKNRIDRLHAEEINRLNAERSAGRAGLHTANEYFSPDEVRSMSPSEVRENFKKIRESMKKWRP